MDELKLCPVPWCERVNKPEFYNPEPKAYCVACPDCGLETNVFATEAEAIAAWNTRAAAAVIADALAERDAEIARLKNMLKPQWFYHGEDQSSDKCRFSPYEVIDEDFFGWGEHKKEGPHLVHISTAMPGPDIWAVVRVLTGEEKDARDDDEPWLIEKYDTEEAARAALGSAKV